MPRKRASPHWSKSLFGVMRSLGKLQAPQARRALKTASRAITSTVKKAKPPRGAGAWTTGVAFGPAGARRYQLLRPPNVGFSERLPLVVMLHGCGQDANAFALSTHMNRLAVRERFMVLYPEQDRLANLQGCWNWYDTDSRRAFAEAATINAAVDQVCALYRADPARVALAGMSAGASMAALMAVRTPGRFQAVTMHSGVPPGAANSALSALRAMHGRGAAQAVPSASSAATAPRGNLPANATGDQPDAAAHWPPLLVIHGSADRVVAPSNGEAAAQLWADAAGAQRTASRTVQRGKRRAMTMTDFKCRGRTQVTLCSVDGLGHAWSGGAAGQPFSDATGPDASAMVWAFAKRVFAAHAVAHETQVPPATKRPPRTTNPSGLSGGGAGGLRHRLEIRRK
jgi:poly(hydroxyalkanoate) depolymerase family esterase